MVHSKHDGGVGNRKHGRVNFHLTQFLFGHGYFRQHLHRFDHAPSPFCLESVNAEELPKHVIFECPRFEEIRVSLRGVTADNGVEEMCHEEMWNAATRILSELQRKWREEQRKSDRDRSRLDSSPGT